ncbi:MAG: hypothetical protein ACFFAU_07260 [Candidatus Hodarchaeota archaeon]
MKQKLARTSLFVIVILVISYIGGIIVINVVIPSIQMNSTRRISENNERINEASYPESVKRDLLNIDDGCCGHVDTTPPVISLPYPPFQSIVLAGTTIEVMITDDNPMYKMSQILYHWDTDLSNTTLTAEDPTKDDLIYEMSVTDEVGIQTLYVYGVDYSGNWASKDFTFTVVLTMNPPVINFIAPSISNESLTGTQVFIVNVTDDLGLVEVKMQVDSGAKLPLTFNESSLLFYRSYNVSMLTNGQHLLKVTAIDVDHQQHTVTESIGFTVYGGQVEAIVSNPPEWDPNRSDLPENMSIYIVEGNLSNYIAETGEIYFKIAVTDDLGIAVVDFIVYALNDFDPNTNEPDISNARTELTESLTLSSSDENWEIYEYTWDSTVSLDNYYICMFEIQDTDEIANRLVIRILLEVDNVIGDKTTTLGRRTPGFEVEFIILVFSSWTLVLGLLKRKNKRRIT